MPSGLELGELVFMSEDRVPDSLPRRLTSRRGAWVSIVIVLLAFVALFGLFGSADAPTGNDVAPSGSESAQVDDALNGFPDHDQQSVLIVATRDDGAALTDADLTALTELLPTVDAQTGLEASRPISSADGEAAVIQTPITVGDASDETSERIASLRAELTADPVDGLTLQVTGGPAFGADITAAFDGADVTLLVVTIALVALLLILTYRSPVLWLIPLVVVGLADQLAGKATSAVGTALSLQFDTGIISVLVFGAGTNYALLLISRYREELANTDDHRTALGSAWRATAPAIIASNLTVVVGLATLVLAVIPGTRGLGITSAVGLLIALAAVLFALPPVLALCGRGVFWPFIPRPGQSREQGRVWRGVARTVMRHPRPALVAGTALLAVMAAGLFGTSLGLSQTEKFRVTSESEAGLETLSQHFPPGEAQPMIVVTSVDETDDVVSAIEAVTDVVRVTATGESDDGALTRLLVTGEPAPGTQESLDLVRIVRDAVHGVPGADALVGGPVAEDLDAREGNVRDLLVIAPLLLTVSFVVLLILLRSLVAPVLLLLVNVASAVAAIGAGAWLSRVLFDQAALDLQVPLLSFLFLVALGVDYTIFLVHRAKTEAIEYGTRQGMVRAIASTGGVITSAGIVLAAVFAALGVLPLVTLGQLGLIVGFGVIVDTLVVRTVIVPAIFSLVGDRIWWPGNAPHARRATFEPQDGESGHVDSAHVPAAVG